MYGVENSGCEAIVCGAVDGGTAVCDRVWCDQTVMALGVMLVVVVVMVVVVVLVVVVVVMRLDQE